MSTMNQHCDKKHKERGSESCHLININTEFSLFDGLLFELLTCQNIIELCKYSFF